MFFFKHKILNYWIKNYKKLIFVFTVKVFAVTPSFIIKSKKDTPCQTDKNITDYLSIKNFLDSYKLDNRPQACITEEVINKVEHLFFEQVLFGNFQAADQVLVDFSVASNHKYNFSYEDLIENIFTKPLTGFFVDGYDRDLKFISKELQLKERLVKIQTLWNHKKNISIDKLFLLLIYNKRSFKIAQDIIELNPTVFENPFEVDRYCKECIRNSFNVYVCYQASLIEIYDSKSEIYFFLTLQYLYQFLKSFNAKIIVKSQNFAQKKPRKTTSSLPIDLLFKQAEVLAEHFDRRKYSMQDLLRDNQGIIEADSINLLALDFLFFDNFEPFINNYARLDVEYYFPIFMGLFLKSIHQITEAKKDAYIHLIKHTTEAREKFSKDDECKELYAYFICELIKAKSYEDFVQKIFYFIEEYRNNPLAFAKYKSKSESIEDLMLNVFSEIFMAKGMLQVCQDLKNSNKISEEQFNILTSLEERARLKCAHFIRSEIMRDLQGWYFTFCDKANMKESFDKEIKKPENFPFLRVLNIRFLRYLKNPVLNSSFSRKALELHQEDCNRLLNQSIVKLVESKKLSEASTEIIADFPDREIFLHDLQPIINVATQKGESSPNYVKRCEMLFNFIEYLNNIVRNKGKLTSIECVPQILPDECLDILPSS